MGIVERFLHLIDESNCVGDNSSKCVYYMLFADALPGTLSGKFASIITFHPRKLSWDGGYHSICVDERESGGSSNPRYSDSNVVCSAVLLSMVLSIAEIP